jgi:protein SCO1/2
VLGALAAFSLSCSGAGAARAPKDLRGTLLGEPLPKPDVTFRTTEGSPFPLRSATEGFVTLIFFGFTHCPNVCPVTMANLGAVLRTLDPAVAQRVKVLFVTVDPWRDTPAVLRAWLDRFNPDIIGLSGDSVTVAQAQVALKLAPAIIERQGPSDTAYSVGHSSLVVAFTPDNLAHVVYPFGTRQEDWAHDLPELVRGGWSRP